MPTFTYTTLFFFLTFLAEIQFGNWGLTLPLSAMFIHYLAVTRSLTLAIGVAVATGTIIDGYYNRSHTITPLIYITIVLLANYVVKKSPIKSLAFQFFPGSLIGLLCSVPYILLSNLEYGFTFRAIFGNLGTIFTVSIITGILLPVCILVLDIINELLEFPLYLQQYGDNP